MKKSNKLEYIRERIIYFVDNYCISRADFQKKTGIKKGMFDPKDITRAVLSDKLEDIHRVYKELNLIWVVTGYGDMLLDEEQRVELKLYSTKAEVQSIDDHRFESYIKKKKHSHGVPFWNLYVSAGKSFVDITGKQKADGYIVGLPGAEVAENIFPVTGMSMEPEIMSSAIIGVRKIQIGESLDTEGIYLIITNEDRMIKRIEHDAYDVEILWCVSTNYPKFKIQKSDIIDIQRVCFVYNQK